MSGKPAEIPPAFTLVSGDHGRPGLGLRVDCPLASGGVLRLVHWFISPSPRMPDGVAEEPHGIALTDLGPCGIDSLECDAACRPLPASRGDWRNLLAPESGRMLGLRGWDIPHDRHAILTDFRTSSARIAPGKLPEQWHAIRAIRVAGRVVPIGAEPATPQETARRSI